MNRRRALLVTATLALVGAGGYLALAPFLRTSEPPPAVPDHADRGGALPEKSGFDKLVETDPVAALDAALTRYQREVKNGLRCTLEMQERVKGKPKHPDPPLVQTIALSVRGDVPDPATKRTQTEVLMKWRSGFRSVTGSEVHATLYSERPKPDGLDGKFVTWRPGAWVKVSPPMSPVEGMGALGDPRNESRYCIRDAGIYRTMLRTHEAWKARQAAGTLDAKYVETTTLKPAGGRECHVIRRVCRGVELDAFELGGTAGTDPKVVAAEGFTEVIIYLDRETWLQVGTETFRTEPDGTKVTVGTYYFRDIDLNPTFDPDTFTVAGMKK